MYGNRMPTELGHCQYYSSLTRNCCKSTIQLETSRSTKLTSDLISSDSLHVYYNWTPFIGNDLFWLRFLSLTSVKKSITWPCDTGRSGVKLTEFLCNRSSLSNTRIFRKQWRKLHKIPWTPIELHQILWSPQHKPKSVKSWLQDCHYPP